MSFWKLVFKSLLHYRGINLAVLAGVALTSAILSGALVVGDSVKESLRQNAAARISNIGEVVIGGDRFFTSKLADNLELTETVAPILQVQGTVATRGGGQRSNAVQIVGVDERFWNLGRVAEFSIEGDFFAINDVLADRLGVKDGDTLISRVEIPGELSKDAPLSGESEQTKPFTEKITHILGANTMGLYSLKAEQIPPGTIFIPLQKLQTILEKSGQVNLLLVGNSESGDGLKLLQAALEKGWKLEDAQIELTTLEAGSNLRHVTTPRVFLDSKVIDTVESALGGREKSDRVLTYLANKIRFGDKKLTPYSMITGATPELNSIVPPDLKDTEIVVSQWLADDLGVSVGEELELEYYVVESGRKLVDTTSKFTVHSIAEIGENGWNQSWTPEFPGIFEVEDLSGWEPGIPIDRDSIRDKDEDFWDEYRATPKAFVTFAAAEKMFANRFGNATSIRFPAGITDDVFEADLKGKLKFSDLGITVRDVAAEAKAAVGQSFDFGQLFAYMSFFLILSALILSALVFIFGIESRTQQIGLLLAVGVSAGRTRRLFLAEATILSVIGALIGLAGGWVYTTLALRGMSSAWQDAAAGIEFFYHLRPVSLAIAFGITVLLALITVWIASRAVMKVQPGHLISGSGDGTSNSQTTPLLKTKAFWLGVVFLLGGIYCLIAPKSPGSMAEQGMFFGGGFCFTLAGVAACALLLRQFEKPSASLTSLAALGRQNAVRRKGRSLAVVGLMAAGVFMVTAINSFRLQGERGASLRDSGTGGFTHVGQSSLPIYEDLNGDQGRKKYGLDQFAGTDFRIVQFRVSDGEDASCLNLNRSQRPRLMAVNPDMLTKVGAFGFAKSTGSEGWAGLSDDAAKGIPGIIDMNTATYALQKKLGDVIEYESSAEEPFGVKLSGFLETSLLQGSIIVAESHFIEQFPDAGGYRFFLLDCPNDQAAAKKIAAHLTREFDGRGLEMRSASARLNEFNAVQNTYLSIFSTLGGLGILLGTIGLAIVVGRNVMERRGQLGLMQAVGFTRDSLAKMVLAEHWFLHAVGVILGVAAAAIAVAPKLFSRTSDLPLGLLIGMNLAILVGGIAFCWIAARVVVRGKLMDALRSE